MSFEAHKELEERVKTPAKRIPKLTPADGVGAANMRAQTLRFKLRKLEAKYDCDKKEYELKNLNDAGSPSFHNTFKTLFSQLQQR